MTDAEKAALEWLDKKISEEHTGAWPGYAKHARTLKALLAEPRLPAEPSEEMTTAFLSRAGWANAPTNREYFRHSYRALYAHLTAPKTKTVEVWRVESSARACGIWEPSVRAARSETEAAHIAEQRKAMGETCIHITGPHKQEIPND